jgi:peptide/nickel transport system ATP-binding protein
VFDNPTHPYTRRLLQAVPELRGNREQGFAVTTRAVPRDLDPTRPYFDSDGADGQTPVLVEVASPTGAHHRIALHTAHPAAAEAALTPA